MKTSASHLVRPAKAIMHTPHQRAELLSVDVVIPTRPACQPPVVATRLEVQLLHGAPPLRVETDSMIEAGVGVDALALAEPALVSHDQRL